MADTSAIYEAIPAILSDVEAIAKSRKNQSQGYNFRGIDDVYNAIHPLLAKHKVFPTCEIVSKDVSERETKSGGALFCVTIKAKYTLFAHDGSCVCTEALGEGMDSGDKATNKAMSAAYKYALFQLLCIPTEAVDSEQDDHDVAPKRTDVKPASKAKEVAAQHGMKTADELPQPRSQSTFHRALDEISKAVANRDESYLVKIAGLITQRKNEGQLTEAEDVNLQNELVVAQRKIEALNNEPAAA